MKIYKGISEFKSVSFPVVTTGTFDGVHQGHRIILERLKEVAKKNNGESVLLTFFPHPRMVLQPESELKLLNTIEEKAELLEEAGIDHLIIHPFDKKFSRLTSIEFVRDILVNKIGTKKLVIGYDHHFGRNREGSFDHLSEFGPLYGFSVEEIPAHDVDHVNVSSTKIRNALLEGDIEVANNYLGYDFFISGRVVHGDKMGRQLGFPTANIHVESSYKLIPKNGIYAVKIKLKGELKNGMANIGTRPTISNSDGSTKVEVNIFDFSEEIYGEEIRLSFVKRIRDEIKFDSLDELTSAMDKDKQVVLNVLK